MIGSLVLVTLILFSTKLLTTDASTSFGLKRAHDGQLPDIGQQAEKVFDQYGALYRDKSGDKTLYLTFDNGYENGHTNEILNTLKQEDIKGTFFLTGHYLSSAPDYVKRMVAEGHTIGNHTYSHPTMPKLSEEQLAKELLQFDDALFELTGITRTSIVRPPEGVYSENTLRIANKLGYQHIFWSMAIVDWYADRRRGTDVVVKELLDQLHPGAIILLHTVTQDNAEALPLFIKEAKKRGYRFGELEELRKQSVNTPIPFH